MSKKFYPIIKFNGGNPVAICNVCRVVMCYVSCTEKDGEYCKVREPLTNNNGEDYISTPIGETPPLYCGKCETLLNYSLNE
jgi:hypothetical protein